MRNLSWTLWAESKFSSTVALLEANLWVAHSLWTVQLPASVICFHHILSSYIFLSFFDRWQSCVDDSLSWKTFICWVLSFTLPRYNSTPSGKKTIGMYLGDTTAFFPFSSLLIVRPFSLNPLNLYTSLCCSGLQAEGNSFPFRLDSNAGHKCSTPNHSETKGFFETKIQYWRWKNIC